MREDAIFIPGPAGRIEARITYSDDPQCVHTAVVCHPHSLYGGTMNNKVVTTLVRAYRERGVHTVRFNFRGVGESTGVYTAGEGETLDVLAVLRWVHEARPHDRLLLAGFSFGAYVVYRVASQVSEEVPIASLITIAPPVNHFDFTPFPSPKIPWTVIQGEEDKTVPAAEVQAWVKTLPQVPDFKRLPNADHFFHGHLLELREAVMRVLW